MKATTKLLLSAEVSMAPVAALPPELVASIADEADDFYLTQVDTPGSIVVDAQTAALLEYFRAPSTVIDAIAAYCHANELEAESTLNGAFGTLAELVSARVLVPAEFASERDTNEEWQTYKYYDVYKNQFSEEECRQIISLAESLGMVTSKINYHTGQLARDCSLFWIPRNQDTDWIFARLWKAGQKFNQDFNFEISPDMGMAQLTRYTPGQQYDWHMDLGPGEASRRKISMVLQLSSNKEMHGAGTEVFYNHTLDNRVKADIGDVVVFPSFTMHRASIVQSGVRWSLVLWLTGPQPLR